MQKQTKVAFIGEAVVEMSGAFDRGNSARISFAGDVLNTATYFARHTNGSDFLVSFVTALGHDR